METVITHEDVIRNAKKCLSSGLSIVPLGLNKQPVSSWKQYQTTPMTDAEVEQVFSTRDDVHGFGIIGGPVSGNLEIIDIDDVETCTAYLDALTACIPDTLKTLPQVRTPKGGLHIYYRHTDVPAGNTKLAMKDTVDDKGVKGKRVLIETRGQGGQVVSPYSLPACHPLHLPYTLLSGDILNIPTITQQERDCLLSYAKSFSAIIDTPDTRPPDSITFVPTKSTPTTTITTNGNQQATAGMGVRPGDDFNARGQWSDILIPKGWTVCGCAGEVTLWTRPGKSGEYGPSATTNKDNTDLMYCFSTSAFPIEDGVWYTKYRAYAVLYHNGDWSKAAADLASQGYGAPGHYPDKSACDAIDALNRLGDDDGDTTTHNLTDTGNASRLAQRHGGNIRYVRGEGDAGEWYCWDGKRWMRDNKGAVARMAKDTVLNIYAEAATETEDDKRKKIRQHAVRSESEHAIGAMIHLARSEKSVAISSKCLDSDPWLFNCENGTIDLRTGAILPRASYS